MSQEKLGPMPEPAAEPPPENPGGADAINEDTPFGGDEPVVLGHDLHPEDNPGVDEIVPDEIGQAEDKKQENEGDDSKPETEDPA